MPSIRRAAVFTAIAFFVASCAPEPTAELAVPLDVSARWDHSASGEAWTAAALAALDGHGQPLVAMTPADIETYCPAYPTAGEARRKAFWVNLLSALSWHESTHRPAVSGGGGKWHGLLQIAPATARGYGCAAKSASELKDGEKNLSCGIRIMARTVARDGVISQGMRGVAADWGPFHQARKRADIQEWTRSRPECRA